MLALLLVSLSLGASNFAAAIGLGVAGVDARTRLRVGIVFGALETAMPLAGLALGRGLAYSLGGAARWTAAALLAGTGVYTTLQGLRGKPSFEDSGSPRCQRREPDPGLAACSTAWRHPARQQETRQQETRQQETRQQETRQQETRQQETGQHGAGLRLGGLVVTAIGLSIDNLAVGFALGAYHVNTALAATVIGVVSVGLSLIGLELGDRIGARAGRRAELAGGVVLMAVGLAVGTGAL